MPKIPCQVCLILPEGIPGHDDGNPRIRQITLRASPFKGLKLSFGDVIGGLHVVVTDVIHYVSGKDSDHDTLEVEAKIDQEYRRISEEEKGTLMARLRESGWTET